jgi:chromosome partitioning protein
VSHRANVTAIVNQKGGTGKTCSTENLGVGLAKEGKKVLLIDLDPQSSLTISLGYPRSDELYPTISTMIDRILNEQPIGNREGILSHPEGVDLMPANIELAGTEMSLANVISREKVLKQYIDTVNKQYDHILIDCSPSLGMLTVNALCAADNCLIPVQAQYLSAKGLEQLLGTISKVKRQINPKLKIEGILLTMVDARTTDARMISELIRETYGSKIRVFDSDIPHSVRAAEISAEGKSIFTHDPGGKVAAAYKNLTKEVLSDGEKRRQHQLSQLR